jgi:choline-sulfatase
MLGERGLWYKMAFFEPSARVPLIVSSPGRFAAGRVDAPVSLLDVAPTLMDLCGVDGGGPGLRAALEGSSLEAADVAVEYLAEGVRSPAVTLRRGRFKYVWCADDPEQLFDLSADPHELVNRASSEPDVCASLRAAVERRWDMPALHAAVLRSQEDRRLVVQALNRGRPTNWSFVPPAGAEPVQGKEDLYEFQRRARLDAPTRSSAMRER